MFEIKRSFRCYPHRSLFSARRYQHQFKSDAILEELKYILELFQEPLLKLFLVRLTAKSRVRLMIWQLTHAPCPRSQ